MGFLLEGSRREPARARNLARESLGGQTESLDAPRQNPKGSAALLADGGRGGEHPAPRPRVILGR
jgi:hypothetical protein